MVGVPGRSKACHTCRQRRIKCGRELPGCLQCVKSKRVCTGYQRKHTFILSQDMVSGAGGSHVSSSSSSLADEPDSGKVMVSRWRLDQQALTRSSSRDVKPLSPTPTTLPDLLSLPPEIHPRNAFRDKLFSLIADSSGVSLTDFAGLSVGDRNDWIVQIVSLPQLTSALEDALLAVCAAHLGRQVEQPALVHEGLRLYISSMSHMRGGMLDNSYDQNLAALAVFLLYEATECPGGNLNGYMAHLNGAIRLLQTSGAGAHMSGLSHSILQIMRIPSVLVGLAQRKRPFLAQPEWLDLPWSLKPDTKTSFDRLVDIFFDIPELPAQREALETIADPRLLLEGASATLREGARIEAALNGWFDSFRATVPGSLYHAQLSGLTSAVDGESGKLFPVSFRFPAFVVAQNLVFYWGAQVYVRNHLCLAHARMVRFAAVLDAMGRGGLPCSCGFDTPDGGGAEAVTCLQHFTAGLLPAFERRDNWPFAPALYVCQSVEYFFQKDEMRTLGLAQIVMPRIVIPALMLVRRFWAQKPPGTWDRHVAWVDDTLGRIRTTSTGIVGAFG